ncbi:MAG: substrate-binding domain-containing protein [Candidatus Methylacidiphilales bacterium]|nr:GntR family transcriptional regulator [Candidatus Methylacidiphilales bacterium]
MTTPSLTSSSGASQYQAVIQQVRAYIDEQGLRHGDRLPPERDFATLFGIGRPTVNKALACLIAEGFLRREGYKLYVAGPPLGETKQSVIGVLCPHPLHRKQRVSHNLVEAAHDVCELAKVRFNPILSMDAAQQRAQLQELLRTSVDGIVMWPHPEMPTKEVLQQITIRNIPFVISDINWGEFDFVGVDNFAGVRKILNHLASLGHREIAYFTKQLSNPNLEERCEGFRFGAARHFSDSSQRRVYKLSGDGEEGLSELFHKFRQKEVGVTAICCSHDIIAIELIQLCLQNGIDVPEQMSIAGFDGIDAGETCSRPLTTVAQDFYQLGALAVDLLIRRIRMRHIKHAAQLQQIHLTPHLVVRASTGRVE